MAMCDRWSLECEIDVVLPPQLSIHFRRWLEEPPIEPFADTLAQTTRCDVAKTEAVSRHALASEAACPVVLALQTYAPATVGHHPETQAMLILCAAFANAQMPVREGTCPLAAVGEQLAANSLGARRILADAAQAEMEMNETPLVPTGVRPGAPWQNLGLLQRNQQMTRDPLA